jgi:hypothetical protein
LPVGSTTDDIKRHYVISVVWEKGKFFAYVHTYEKQANKKWKVLYEKYNYTPQGNGTSWFSFNNPIESEEEMFEYLPLFVFNNDIQNDEDFDFEFNQNSSSQAGQYFNCEFLWESDYADLIDMCLEINDRTTQVSIEYFKHLNSKMSYPSATTENRQKERDRQLKLAEKQGLISSGDASKIRQWDNSMASYEWYTHSPGERPAQYISKDNGHLAHVDNHTEWIIRKISAISRIPVHFFGLSEASWNARVWTTLAQSTRFYQRILAKRMSMRPVLQRMFAYMTFLENGNYEIPTIQFAKVTVKDLVAISESMALLKSSWLVSTETAVGAALDLDGKELDAELEKINNDASITNAIQPETTLPSL